MVPVPVRRRGSPRRRSRCLRPQSRSCRLRRLVLGHAGTISFEALRWLHGVGAAFVQVGADGEVIAATAPAGLDDPRLRRAHALAATNGVGLGIALDLLREKLRGQAEVLGRLAEADGPRAVIEQALAECAACSGCCHMGEATCGAAQSGGVPAGYRARTAGRAAPGNDGRDRFIAALVLLDPPRPEGATSEALGSTGRIGPG